jgi:hypothetical protein
MRGPEHETIRSKLDFYSAGSLDDVDWLLVRTHLAECDTCRMELGQRAQWNRASPQRILPSQSADDIAPVMCWCSGRSGRNPPGWPIVFGVAVVAAMVSFGIGYALGSGV